jgi:Zn-dependent protease with chaperone function
MYSTDANFYDGLSSVKHNVRVFFLEHQIAIEVWQDADMLHQYLWDPNKVAKVDIGNSTVVRLYYEYNNAKQVLEINNPNTQEWLRLMYPGSLLTKEHFGTVHSKNIFVLGGAFVVVVCFLAFLYFWGLPFASDLVAKMIPDSIEREYGQGITNTYLTTETIDSAASENLNDFFDAMHIEKNNEVQLYVVKSDVVNAFAFPGKTIIVFDEIIRRTTNKEQLAALLAHEYAHVKQRHAIRSMAAGMSSGILLSIVIGDASGALGGLAQNADQLRLLKYSRDFETEADNIGLDMLEESKINPTGMAELFQLLQTEEKAVLGNSNIMDKLEFLSTHPLTKERIKNAEHAIKQKSHTVEENNKMQTHYEQLKKEIDSVIF